MKERQAGPNEKDRRTEKIAAEEGKQQGTQKQRRREENRHS